MQHDLKWHRRALESHTCVQAMLQQLLQQTMLQQLLQQTTCSFPRRRQLCGRPCSGVQARAQLPFVERAAEAFLVHVDA
eukprot:243287-Chlamydomonas_euryale.AAC.5